MTRRIAQAITTAGLVVFLTALLTVAWSWAAIAWIAASAAATFVAVFVVTWLRLGRDLDNAVAELNTAIDVDRAIPYGCCVRGHNLTSHIEDDTRVWDCTECDARYVSGPGWVDGRTAS